jgi:hypothetical protein
MPAMPEGRVQGLHKEHIVLQGHDGPRGRRRSSGAGVFAVARSDHDRSRRGGRFLAGPAVTICSS